MAKTEIRGEQIKDTDITVSDIANSAVTNVKMANMAQNTIKGRVTASSGPPEDLSSAQALSLIGAAAAGHTHSFITNTVAIAAYSITAANGTWVDTGGVITLPSAGLYLLLGNIRVSSEFSVGASGLISLKFMISDAQNSPLDISGSIRLATSNDMINQLHVVTCPMMAIVNVTVSSTVQLYAMRSGATTWVTSSINNDSNGQSRLSYVKLLV